MRGVVKGKRKEMNFYGPCDMKGAIGREKIRPDTGGQDMDKLERKKGTCAAPLEGGSRE